MNWEPVFDQLAERGFAVVDDFLDAPLLHLLRERMRALEQHDELEKAGIGTLGDYRIRESMRGDYIHWLEAENPNDAAYLERMQELRQRINRTCFLSLSGEEFHFASYPPGSYYIRHLDQFKGRNNRMISCILYLNANWEDGDQGCLRIYPESGPSDIEPLLNRLVLFRSDELEHEVLPTRAYRRSITGWFLYQKPGLGFL